MEHMIVQIGLLLAIATFLVIVFHLLKQSAIFAYIATGMIAAFVGGSFQLPNELVEVFTEVGIILLLFMAGMEVNIKTLIRRWRIVAINGAGQIVLNALLGIFLAYALLGIENTSTAVFFGLCLTFSSTIVVIGSLKDQRQIGSFHGQIILGLMVLQDIVAVLSLAVLKGLGSDASPLVAIALLLLKLVLLVVVLGVLAKFMLKPVFRRLADNPEHLLVGTLGYALGVAAICELVHFSPEIGAFVAGVSLAVLPYKLEIEDKVEPLKTFGVVLFFVTLGYKLNLADISGEYFVPVVVITAVAVLGTPILMLLLGWFSRIHGRPAFIIGGTINQISEFSLILATLCVGAGVFDDAIFNIVTVAFLASLVFSSLGMSNLDRAYEAIRRILSFIDRRAISEIESEIYDLEGHVVLISYNELTEAILPYFRAAEKKIVVVEIDPYLCEYIKKTWPDVMTAYADPQDPDTWEELGFNKAALIVSNMLRGQEAELGLAHWLKEQGVNIPIIATTDSDEEALELYASGYSYVVQTENLAASELRNILEKATQDGETYFTAVGRRHFSELRQKSESEVERFHLL